MEIKNYGNNISIKICKKKYILGNNMNISLVIIMTFTYTIIFISWVILLYKLYSLYVFIIGAILYLLMLYYYLKSFFTEPGIIPRNYEKLILNGNFAQNKGLKNIKENESISFQTLESSTKSDYNLESSPVIITNIHEIIGETKEENEKKIKNIFPDFILADSSEDLNNNIQLNNSINAGIENSVFSQKVSDPTQSIYSNQKEIYFNNKALNKDNSQNSLRKENSIEIYENNYVPHIFKKRPCKTCNIMRPPKTSHCVICDNCIMELDHHCFYISNCVGARNRKYFIFFLLFGDCLSVLCILTSLYHLLFTFLIQNKYKYLTILLFKKYYIPLIISFIIMLAGILILLFKKESIKLSCAIFIPGNILFNVFFYYNKNKNQIEKKFFFDLDYHPLSLCLIYALLPLFLFVCKYLKKQIKLVGKGLTTKQFFSIKEERNSNKKNKEIYDYLDSILKRKVNFKNVFKFFFTKQKKSLININNNKKMQN